MVLPSAYALGSEQNECLYYMLGVHTFRIMIRIFFARAR